MSRYFSQAYAEVTGPGKAKFIVQLTKFLDNVEIDLPNHKDFETLTPLFNDALARFIKLSDDPDYQLGVVPLNRRFF